MNRSQIEREKKVLATRMVILSKRIISLDNEYNELRAQIEKLPGESEDRKTLHFKAAEKLIEKKKKIAEFESIERRLLELQAERDKNRNTIIQNGKAIREGKAVPNQNRDIPAT